MSEDCVIGAARFDRPAGRLAGFAESRFVPLVLVLVAAGVILRMALIWTTTSPSFPENLLYPGYGDGARYVMIAHSLLETGTFGYAGRPTAFRSPAYPAFIAATWRVAGTTLTPVRLLQVGMFVLMSLVYAGAVAKRFGRLAGSFTVALLSLHPMLLFLSAEIATENLYMVLESCVFALALVLLEPELPSARRSWTAFGAGLCCGAGALTRPNMFAVFLAVAALMVWRGASSRERWTSWVVPVAALALGNYLVIGPWLIRNQRTVGAPVLATNIDYNLFRGTFDVVGALPPGPVGEGILVRTFRAHNVMYEGEIEDAGRTRLPFDEASNEHRARTETLAIIRSDPGGWIRERLRNAVYLWLNLQWEGDRFKNPVVRVASACVTLFYYILLAAAVAGSVSLLRAGDRARRRFVLMAWLFILAVMPVVLTIVGKRYRVAMIDPFLILLASAWLGSWIARVGDRPAAHSPGPWSV